MSEILDSQMTLRCGIKLASAIILSAAISPVAVSKTLIPGAFPVAISQTPIPGAYPVGLDQTKDTSGLVISSANQDQIPLSLPYGDQGYTVNAWGNCNCIGNPALNNNDTLRVIEYNPGTGPAQVNGISIYEVGGAADAPDIGQTTGLHIIGVAKNSGPMWGIDVEMADSQYLTGYSLPHGPYLDNEFDANIGGNDTTLTYLSFGGMILSQPKYAAGLTLNFIGPGKLTEWLYSYDGTTDIGLHLGRFSKQLHPNDGSQSIKMDWSDSKGNPNSLSLTAYNDTMVLQTTDKAAPASYAVDGAAGIYTKIRVNSECTLDISGGLVTGTEGKCW